MSHAFDHGLPKPLRTLVRDGVILALAPLLATPGGFASGGFDAVGFATVPGGGYLQAIESFPAPISGNQEEQDSLVDLALHQLDGRSPALLVAIGDKRYENTGTNNRRYLARLAVQVVTFSNHGRSQVERLAADVVAASSNNADPGVEIILEHVEQLLIGNNLGIGSKATEIIPIGEEGLALDAQQTLFASNFEIRVSRDVLDHRTALASIRSFLTILHGKPAPGGGQPDHQTELETTL